MQYERQRELELNRGIGNYSTVVVQGRGGFDRSSIGRGRAVSNSAIDSRRINEIMRQEEEDRARKRQQQISYERQREQEMSRSTGFSRIRERVPQEEVIYQRDDRRGDRRGDRRSPENPFYNDRDRRPRPDYRGEEFDRRRMGCQRGMRPGQRCEFGGRRSRDRFMDRGPQEDIYRLDRMDRRSRSGLRPRGPEGPGIRRDDVRGRPFQGRNDRKVFGVNDRRSRSPMDRGFRRDEFAGRSRSPINNRSRSPINDRSIVERRFRGEELRGRSPLGQAYRREEFGRKSRSRVRDRDRSPQEKAYRLDGYGGRSRSRSGNFMQPRNSKASEIYFGNNRRSRNTHPARDRVMRPEMRDSRNRRSGGLFGDYRPGFRR